MAATVNLNVNARKVFNNGDTTPSVKGGNWFVAGNRMPTVITDFDDGIEGQQIVIICATPNTTAGCVEYLKKE